MAASEKKGLVVSVKKRKIFSGEFKAKVALEAMRGIKTVNEIAQELGVHPTQVGLWKKELQEQAARLFEAKRGPKPVDQSSRPERLYSEIGRLKMELDWLKKKSGISL
jgi:transposase-like protein